MISFGNISGKCALDCRNYADDSLPKNGIYLYFVVVTVVLVQMGLHKMKGAKDTADSRQPEADKREKVQHGSSGCVQLAEN